MSLAAGTRLGPYEIGSLIGKGGMGEVYRARDTKLDRDVAIKVLPEETFAGSCASLRERVAPQDSPSTGMTPRNRSGASKLC